MLKIVGTRFKRHRPKVTPEQAEEMVELSEQGMTWSEIGKRYGIAPDSVKYHAMPKVWQEGLWLPDKGRGPIPQDRGL